MSEETRDTYVVTEHEALSLVEQELRRRHVESRTQGIVRLPVLQPKPVPPPEFWTQEADVMGVARVSPVAAAVEVVRALMRKRRYDKRWAGTPGGEEWQNRSD